MDIRLQVLREKEHLTEDFAWVWSAAAAKPLQSCLTLCDSIDGSPPGSAIPGILQARTMEWVAISFSNADPGNSLVSLSQSVGEHLFLILTWAQRRLSAEELMLLKFGAVEDSWDSFGQQRDQTSQP